MYSVFFRRYGPLFFALLLVFCSGWFFFSSLLQSLAKGGGENCRTDIDCSNLSLQIVLAPTNVSTDCSINTACGGGDNFRQLFYTVRLKYTSANPMDDFEFNLDYHTLRVKIKLAVSGLSPVLFSRINKHVTELCYRNGPGANWGNTTGGNYNVAKFETEPYTVTLDFLDDVINQPCGGDLIHFTPGACLPGTPGLYCAYADLFIVAVDAYPGEQIQLQCQEASFDPAVGVATCDLPCNYEPASAVTVALPTAPSGAPNSNLMVRLKDPIAAANGKGGCDIGIEIANTGNDAASVYYLEFVVKVNTDQVMQALEVTSNYSTLPIASGDEVYLRFVAADFIPVAANSAVSLGTITINPPVLQNQGWSAVVRLVDVDKARLQAGLFPSGAVSCSALPVNTDVQMCNDTGDPACGSGFPVVLKVWPPENASPDCPSAKKVRVGLAPASPGTSSIDLRHFSFKLNFDLVHGAAITGADLNPASDPSRDLCVSTEPAGCVDCFGSSQTDCWEPVGDAVFQYCFDRSNTSARTLNVSGDGAYLDIFFNSSGCINGVTVTNLAIKLDGGQAMCIPPTEPLPDPFSICEPQIYGQLATEQDMGLEGVTVTLKQTQNAGDCNPGNCPDDTKTTSGTPEPGKYSFCPCPACTDFLVEPSKNDDPLNGVSTFDLVLINKHILGLDTLDSPYKMIAADANKSNSITTFDIIEFRKLILGVYSSLPNNTSWRFLQSDFIFSDTLNPFSSKPFFETDSVPPSTINFIGIKIGDVSDNAVTHSRPGIRPSTTVGWPSATATRGKTLTVPVIYTGEQPMEAIQLGLRFDPQILELIGPSKGDLPAMAGDNFGLIKAPEGEIRMLWLPDGAELDQYILPGTVLFHLSFNLLAPMPQSGLPLRVDDSVLESLAWRPDALEYSLRGENLLVENRFLPSVASLHAICRPNPTASDVIFSIDAPENGTGRIALFDAFGKLIFMRKVNFMAGMQDITVSEIAPALPGVYVWKVFAFGEKIIGHLIKQ